MPRALLARLLGDVTWSCRFLRSALREIIPGHKGCSRGSEKASLGLPEIVALLLENSTRPTGVAHAALEERLWDSKVSSYCY